MKRLKLTQVMIIGYALLFVLAAWMILRFEIHPNNKSEKIAFITNGALDEGGWSTVHYNGIKGACEALGAELLAYPQVDEYDGSGAKIIEQLSKNGVGMVVLDSHAAYVEELKDVFANYPDIAFYGDSIVYDSPNVTGYTARLYQVRYMSGIIAGMQTKTGKIGYVAAYRDCTCCRGINAFALGVRRVNPNAEVIVAWTNSFDNEEREKALARGMISGEKVDVITYHQNRPNVIEVAEALGIASIGYYDELKDASDNYLTCAACDWEPVYEDMISNYLQGQGGMAEFDWLGLGLRSNAVRLTDYSPLVSQAAKDEAAKAKNEIESGLDVFTNEIYDNEGKLRCGEGESITDDTLLYKMTWLAEGVREYEEN